MPFPKIAGRMTQAAALEKPLLARSDGLIDDDGL
jgi:hypothetical protein